MFAKEHPLARSHVQMRWTTSRIPVLIGPQIPRADRCDTRERYCRAILTLFRPWRTFHDLCHVNEAWHDALNVHANDFSDCSKQIIGNIELLHECKNDRDENLIQMINEDWNGDSCSTQYERSNETGETVTVDEDCDELLDLLDMHTEDASDNSLGMVSASTDENVYIQNAIRCVTESERFVPYVCGDNETDIRHLKRCSKCGGQSFSSIDSFYSVASNDDINLNTRWQISMREAKRAVRESILNGAENKGNDGHGLSSCNAVVTSLSQNAQVIRVNDSIADDHIRDVELKNQAIYPSKGISDEFRLNTEQNRAFMIITDHLNGKNVTGASKTLNAQRYRLRTIDLLL